MARGINKFIGIGNLCSDPEMHNFPDGGASARITIACNDSYKDKVSGEVKDTTEFVRVSFSGKLADIAAQYLRKGSKVYVEGKLKTSKYQDKQTGADKYSTEIVAREMQMLDSKDGGSVSPSAPQAPAPMAAPAPQAPAPQAPSETNEQMLARYRLLPSPENQEMWNTLTNAQKDYVQANI